MEKLLLITFGIFFCTQLSVCDPVACIFESFADGYNCKLNSTFESKVVTSEIIGTHSEGRAKDNSMVEVFYISSSSPTKFVPAKICKFMTNIREFDIYGHKIIEVNKELFEGCNNVTSVTIENSKIESIASDFLSNLENLQSFAFKNTKVQFLHEDFFKNNLKLKNIILMENVLKVINVDFTPLKSIENLSLFGNLCTSVGFSVNNPRSPSLSNVSAEIKEKCNNNTNPNVLSTTPAIETSNELRLVEIEIALEVAEDGSKGVDELLQQESLKIEKLFQEVKKNFEEKFKDSSNLQPTIKNITDEYKKIYKIQEQFKESSKNSENNFAEINAQFDSIQKLEEQNQNFRESIDHSENMMLGIFALQLCLIAYAVYITVYFKFN